MISYWISVYIHLNVFPLLKHIPTYLTNSAQLGALIEKVRPPADFIFLQADVDSLYPLTNITDGIQAMFTFLQNVSDYLKSKTVFLLKLTKWVLTINYVLFGSEIFL